MRTGSLGLLVLLMVGAAQAQLELPAPSGGFLPSSSGKKTSRPARPSTFATDVVVQQETELIPLPKDPPKANPQEPTQTPAAATQQPQEPQAHSSQQNAREAELARLRLDHYGPRERFWMSAGPLLWWMRDSPAPGPLVTTSSVVSQGALGTPDTVILAGANTVDFEEFAGLQLRGGAWLNCKHTWGIEFGGFLLEQKSESGSFASDGTGNPLLARPIINAVTRGELGVIVASPSSNVGAAPLGTISGSVDTFSDAQFWGGEANLMRNLLSCESYNFDLLFGFRYLDLEENLQVTSSSQVVTAPGALVVGNVSVASQTVADRFFTRNQFYGGQIGGRLEWWRGPLVITATGKVAFGPNHETVKISGTTSGTMPGGASVTASGGLLAVPGGTLPLPPTATPTFQAANGGRNTTNWFAVAPEVGLSAGIQMTDALRATLGYSYLYINQVARPGSQVNRLVNPSFVPSSLAFGSQSGPAEPRLLTRQENFYAHGVNLSLEIRY